MAFTSVKEVVATAADASPAQFDEWRRAWRATTDAGATEPLLTFIARERGLGEEVFVQRLAKTLGWPDLEIAKLVIEDEVRGASFHQNRLPIFSAPDRDRQRRDAGGGQRSVRRRDDERGAV